MTNETRSGQVGRAVSAPSPSAPSPQVTAERIGPHRRVRGARENLIVVGLDPSGAARRAVEWAAAEASARRAALQIVHAYKLPLAGYPRYSEMPGDAAVALRSGAIRLLETTALEVERAHPYLRVNTTLVHGEAGSVLRVQSGCGLLTVIGSAGEGRLARSVKGSIAFDLVASGHSPVALIPFVRPDRTTNVVVLGLDQVAEESGAIEFAFEAARAHRTSLIAVHCWTERAGDDPLGHVSAPHHLSGREQGTAALLSRHLKEWSVLYPDVPVEERLILGSAAERLLVSAKGSLMLVIGSRGRGRFTGILLGSTSQSLIAHAGCPVVVIRAGTSN